MYTKMAIISFLAATLTTGVCAPVSDINTKSILAKRADTCEIEGWIMRDMSISGGYGPSIATGSTKSGITVRRKGEKGIWSSESLSKANPIQLKDGPTISKGDTKLPSDIVWHKKFNMFIFTGCSIDYNGAKYTGKADGSVTPGVGYSGDTSSCTVEFPC